MRERMYRRVAQKVEDREKSDALKFIVSQRVPVDVRSGLDFAFERARDSVHKNET